MNATLRRGEGLLLAVGVFARLGLGVARLLAEPSRFRSFEESYNATEAWMLAHGGLLGAVARLQYRSFCGGCSVVSLIGVPALAVSDRLLAWKLVPLAWTAATQVAGFFAVDAWAGRAAAWAFLLLFTLPPVGALDLSLMAWGNHQETALFVALALLLVARGRPVAAALTLGGAVWFARTAAYAAVVLLPAALRTRGRRVLTVVAFGVGLLPLALPTADGDAGWYRFDDTFGPSTTIARRAAALLAPGPLADRLWLPLRGMGWAGGVVLAAAALAGLVAVRERRTRVFVALAVAYAVAFVGTRFPVFIAGAHVPVNNLRYHAPWVFVGMLVVAAGSRRLRWVPVVVCLGVDLVALGRLRWSADATPGSALDVPHFVATVASRLTPEDAAGRLADPLADAVRARLRGLALGHAARGGVVPPVAPDEAAGFGEGLVDPCLPLGDADRVVPAASRRGAALTLSFCPERDRAAELAALPDAAAWASVLGRGIVEPCSDERGTDAACLAARLAALDAPLRDEAAWGAGLVWGDPARSDADVEAMVARVGEAAVAFHEGAREPAAGMRQPAFARERARPGARE